MRRSIHRILTAAAALPLALGVVSVTAAGSATAVTVHPDTCTHPTPHDNDTTVGSNIVANTPVRTGPWAACGTVTTLTLVGRRLNYWCYVINGNGFLWTYVNVAGSPVNGWVLNGNLSGDGSHAPC